MQPAAPPPAWKRTAARGVSTLGIGLLAAVARDAGAQAAAASRSFSIVPSLSVSETLTDNIRPGSDKQADLITQILPGLHVSSSAGRLTGFLDYSLSGVAYARHSSYNELQNALSSVVRFEAVENWLFVDATANISQQLLSAFGTRTADPGLVNDNRTEVRSYSVSPYVKGRLAGFAEYEGRVNRTETHSGSNAGSDNTTTSASLRLNGNGAGRFGWSVDASRQTYDYGEGRQTQDDRLRGVLNITTVPELRLQLIGGREASDFTSDSRRSSTTWGYGGDWSPTDRTHVSARHERRPFGSSHSFSVQHRMARSVFSYFDTKDVSTGFGQPVLNYLGTASQVQINNPAIIALYPDENARAAFVNQWLQAQNVAPTDPVYGGSLASAVTLQRRQELSVALSGVRDTLSLVASQTSSRRLDSVAVVADDFSNGNLVRQRGVSLNLTHRLTPVSSLSLVASIDRTLGSQASQSTTLRSLRLMWTGDLGSRIYSSLGARHSASGGGASASYAESALLATLGWRF